MLLSRIVVSFLGVVSSCAGRVSYFREDVLLVRVLPRSYLSWWPTCVVYLLSFSGLVSATSRVGEFHVVVPSRVSFTVGPSQRFFRVRPSVFRAVSAAIYFGGVVGFLFRFFVVEFVCGFFVI